MDPGVVEGLNGQAAVMLTQDSKGRDGIFAAEINWEAVYQRIV